MLRMALLVLLSATSLEPACSWGFYGHRKINYMACFTLPPEMFGFYKKHIAYITDHAVDADKRRYSDKAEAPRHYIDIDHYGERAIDSIPKHWTDAVSRYTEDSLNAYGIVPWYIPLMMRRLTEAFREKNISRILYYSANLGHYIADAHVPLHCTENYNGQMTGQHGIHAFWESRLPELFGEGYDCLTGRSLYITDIQYTCWLFIRESSTATDSVLSMERALNESFPSDRKYVFESRGNTVTKTYSREYAAAYNRLLDGQVERRMLSAILSVGSFWYTAWINAGSPDLDPDDSVTDPVPRKSDVVIQDFMNHE